MRRKPIIAIDAGHGRNTAGKRCLKSIDPSQTREWVLNDRIADDLQARLAAYECTVIRVDDTTGEKDISLSARVRLPMPPMRTYTSASTTMPGLAVAWAVAQWYTIIPVRLPGPGRHSGCMMPLWHRRDCGGTAAAG